MVRAHHPGAKAVPPRGFTIGGACARRWIGAFFESSRGAVGADAPRGRVAGAPVARVPRAGASGNDVTTGDPLYVKARRGVVLGFCAMANCPVNGRIAGQKAAAAEPVA